VELSEARAQWRGPETKAFLDAACCSIIPQPTKRALIEFIEMCEICPQESSSAYHIAMDSRRIEPVHEAARLLNADVEEIALVESTTYGLNVAAMCLEMPEGSTVLTCDLEFLQVAIPWTMQKDRGITVRVVPSDYGRIEAADFERAVDDSTKMIVLSSVQWCNGWKADLEAFGRLCQERGLWFVVDAVHHVGIVGLDTKACHMDMMVAGGHKWLNAPFGCGILYINRRLLPAIEPKMWGYLALEEPEGGWGTYFGTPGITPVADWTFQRSAKRFEIAGTSNYLGAIALGESLKIVNAIGIGAIEQHARELTSYLMDQLESAGAFLVTHRDEEHRSGMVVFRFYDSLDEENQLLRRLHERGVYVAMRFTSNIGGIRVSCHFFNNRSDVDRLIDELHKAAGEKPPDYRPPRAE